MVRSLTVILLSCFFLSVSAQAGEANIGSIENSAGGTLILHEGKTFSATAGAVLQLNDIVVTNPGGLLRLALTDGSALLLQENTELRVVTFDTAQQQTLVEMLHGHILVEVAPYTKPGARFVVDTPTASVLAIGTTLEVETASSAGTITSRQVDDLPTSGRNPNSLIALEPGTATKVGNAIKAVPPKNSIGQPAQPTSLLGIQPGTFNASGLGQYPNVGATLVGGLNHFVVTSNINPSIPGVTFLSPGQSAQVTRDYSPDLGGPLVKDKLWFWGSYGRNDIRNTSTNAIPGWRDFGGNGQPCTPGIVVNGQPISIGGVMPNFQYKVLGMGTSTGNALQLQVTNQGPCPLYFFVPSGTIMQPKGFTERVITGFLLGGTPSLKDFQKMITFGLFLRIGPPGLVTAEPPMPVSNDVTEAMRSYCVQLHKLAPHPKTEYKFGDEGDQNEYGGNLQVLDRAFQLLQSGQIQSSMGHGLDPIVQWSLWAKLGKMDRKDFSEEYEKLVRKNFEAKREKIDKATEQRVKDSEEELWKLVQVVLK
ncbi:MAG TPA: FecR family protein [Candidatus Acidoferrales bacterium]|nr:FecR family protein [Candidatus Acidoferrales bacterium]